LNVRLSVIVTGPQQLRILDATTDRSISVHIVVFLLPHLVYLYHIRLDVECPLTYKQIQDYGQTDIKKLDAERDTVCPHAELGCVVQQATSAATGAADTGLITATRW
jgi:hypothetical protein